MARSYVALVLGGYLLAAAVFGVIQHYAGPVSRWDDAAIGRAVFAALSLFILSGVAASAWWSTHPAGRSGAGLLKFWGLFGLAVGLLMLFGRHHSIF